MIELWILLYINILINGQVRRISNYGPTQQSQVQQGQSPQPQFPQYSSPVSSQPKRKSWIPAFIILIVGLILIFITMILPWFSVHANVNMDMGAGFPMDMEGDFGFGLSSLTTSTTTLGFTQTQTVSYGDIQNLISMYTGMLGTNGSAIIDSAMNQINAVFDTFSLAQIFVIIGLIMSIVALILIAIAGLSGRISGSVGGVFGLIAAILMLVAAFYLVFALPNAINPIIASTGEQISFWGTYSYSLGGTDINLSWGAGIGWYLAIVAFIILLIGASLAFGIKKSQPTTVYTPVLQPSMQR
jgi:hypothetical protein